jgi:hypothetical protein
MFIGIVVAVFLCGLLRGIALFYCASPHLNLSSFMSAKGLRAATEGSEMLVNVQTKKSAI